MSDVPQNVLEQIQKIFSLAAKNTNEAEAASALKKGNELLERYNLTFEAVSEAKVGSGAREKAALEGGFHQWQRELWQEVAGLNFVLYWNQREYNWNREKDKYGTVRDWKHKNYLVGRRVNVAATKAMASYLAEVATRLAKEKTRGENPTHTMGNWANSYRHGVVARICRMLRERRNEALKDEESRRAADMRSADGVVSTATAVALHVYIDKETDANLDFVYGEGWSAKRAAQRAQDAAVRRMSRDQYTQWAAEHPEEAAQAEASRRRQARSRGGSSRDDSNIDSGAYWTGYEDGKNVSIDQQVDRSDVAGRLGR